MSDGKSVSEVFEDFSKHLGNFSESYKKGLELDQQFNQGVTKILTETIELFKIQMKQITVLEAKVKALEEGRE